MHSAFLNWKLVYFSCIHSIINGLLCVYHTRSKVDGIFSQTAINAEKMYFKGTVRRDLRGVKSGINRYIFLESTNASLWISISYVRHLEIHVKPFSVS
jgi:hypothetical protein